MSFNEYEKSWCNRILNELFKWSLTNPFRNPVDPVKDGASNYYSIVTNPIDLNSIRKKLNENKYNTCEQFIDDIKLIHSNSVLYNGDNSIITYIASDVLKWFETQLPFKSISYEDEWRRKLKNIIDKMHSHMELDPSNWRNVTESKEMTITESCLSLQSLPSLSV